MFFLSPMEQVFSTRVSTVPAASSQSRTVRTREPSATRIFCPGFTELARLGYVQAIMEESPRWE